MDLIVLVSITVIRVGESVMTGIAYSFLGLYSASSLEIIPYIVPSVLLGIPLGTCLIRWVESETFRRICMAFDGLVVGFGLSRVDGTGLGFKPYYLQHPHDCRHYQRIPAV